MSYPSAERFPEGTLADVRAPDGRRLLVFRVGVSQMSHEDGRVLTGPADFTDVFEDSAPTERDGWSWTQREARFEAIISDPRDGTTTTATSQELSDLLEGTGLVVHLPLKIRPATQP